MKINILLSKVKEKVGIAIKFLAMIVLLPMLLTLLVTIPLWYNDLNYGFIKATIKEDFIVKSGSEEVSIMVGDIKIENPYNGNWQNIEHAEEIENIVGKNHCFLKAKAAALNSKFVRLEPTSLVCYDGSKQKTISFTSTTEYLKSATTGPVELVMSSIVDFCFAPVSLGMGIVTGKWSTFTDGIETGLAEINAVQYQIPKSEEKESPKANETKDFVTRLVRYTPMKFKIKTLSGIEEVAINGKTRAMIEGYELQQRQEELVIHATNNSKLVKDIMKSAPKYLLSLATFGLVNVVD